MFNLYVLNKGTESSGPQRSEYYHTPIHIHTHPACSTLQCSKLVSQGKLRPLIVEYTNDLTGTVELHWLPMGISSRFLSLFYSGLTNICYPEVSFFFPTRPTSGPPKADI